MNEKNYKRFSTDIDFSTVDHIVVGSGIGGLTTATWLAKAGRKVVVLEQHYVPGGFTHTFKRKQGFKWDVGVHYVGNMDEDSILKKFFNFISDGRLKWNSMGEVYDQIRIGDDVYNFKSGVDNFKAQLIEYFPAEAEAIDAYISLILKVAKRGSGFFVEKSFEPFLSKGLGWFFKKRFKRYAKRTTYDVISELTDNQRLLTVLCGQCGDYGLSPKRSSFGVHAIIVSHFLEGGYYPEGGADTIWQETLKTLVDNGGELYVKANVQEIVTNKRRVTGVKVNDHFIACKSVISNVGLENTYKHLVNGSIISSRKPKLNEVEPSTGHLCLYVGLDQSDAALDLPKHNVWYFEHDNIDEGFEEVEFKNVADKYAYISFPSAKDEAWEENHGKTATIQALTIGKYEWFSDYEDKAWMNRGEEYEQMKAQFETQMLNRLYQLFPQIKGHVIETEVSTPLSTKHFTKYQHGEIYGLAHSPERFDLDYLRPQTKVKGLRLVGQDITIVGLSSSMVSGVLCAITILKFRVGKLFFRLFRHGK